MRDPHVREIISKLKQDIVARAAESRAMTAAANALAGLPRHQKQMERRAFGRCTRWRLLAYTWLRARPYARAEPRAVVPVDPWAIRRVLDALGLEVDVGLLRAWLQGESVGHEGAAASVPAAQESEDAPCAASSTS